MNNEEFYKRLAVIDALPPAELDEEEKASLAKAQKINAGHEPRLLEDVLAEIEGTGRITLRLSKVLHKKLVLEATQEGVSLNHLIVQKISGAPTIINNYYYAGVGASGH